MDSKNPRPHPDGMRLAVHDIRRKLYVLHEDLNALDRSLRGGACECPHSRDLLAIVRRETELWLMWEALLRNYEAAPARNRRALALSALALGSSLSLVALEIARIFGWTGG